MPGKRADIAVIGLAVMGQNLILNMNDCGFVVCVYNRTVDKITHFLSNEAKDTNVIGAYSLEELVLTLKIPRRIMMLVKAGQAVDDFIEKLVPLLSPGDILIDGGNSEYADSTRREKHLRARGLLFIGTGVSGGEEGARHGPSLMPGGSEEAWPYVKEIFQAISAKADGDPCCDWVGPEGSGHFVKMVHNGIEYGDMQIICEAYHLMRQALDMSNDEIAEVFAEWNKDELESYLIEITSYICQSRDVDGSHVIDKIYDSAGQKGTGKWTAIAALQHGAPLTLIAVAVFSRCLSALKDERIFVSQQFTSSYNLNTAKKLLNKKQFLTNIRQALYASKIVSYAQGFMLMKSVGQQMGWKLNLGGIALMWRGGCIIRSKFLGQIRRAYTENPDLMNLLLDEFFKTALHECQESWRVVVSQGALLGIPVPAFSAALSFFDGYRSARLPANLIQAMRDYFGAHTYSTLDNPHEMIHNDWKKMNKGDLKI